MNPKPTDSVNPEPAPATAASRRPRWFDALLAWYLGWLGRIFTGKL